MKKIVAIFAQFAVVAGGLALYSGCGTSTPQQISPQEFYARRSPTPSPIPQLDRPGPLPSIPDARYPTQPPPAAARNSGPVNSFDESDYTPLPPVQVATTQPSTAITATTLPSNILSSSPLAASSTTNPSNDTPDLEDQYMTLGGVVTVVNGTPIYSNKVLRLVTPILRQYARDMSEPDFENSARQKIEEQIGVLRNDELEVAAAEHSLDPKQIAIAKELVRRWREMQVAEAGGSEQVARARAEQASPGEDFQDLEDEQYRSYLWEVYKAYKIDPDIQFTAEDERQYYNQHIAEFTTPTKATIILIECDPQRIGSEAKAKARLKDIRKRALNGEDFASYAREENDLPGAAGSQGTGGLLTDIKPNTLVFTQVDHQIWKLPVGQISDVIADSGAFYMFKLISRDIGSTRAFADAAVQEYIKRRLSALALNQQREAEIEKLNEEGIADPLDPKMIDVAVEMALQNYPIWSKQKQGPRGVKSAPQSAVEPSSPNPQ